MEKENNILGIEICENIDTQYLNIIIIIIIILIINNMLRKFALFATFINIENMKTTCTQFLSVFS